MIAALVGVLSSLALDYVVRQKVGGTNMSFYFVEQFPIVGPDDCAPIGDFMTSRVLELAYTAVDLALFTRDLG